MSKQVASNFTLELSEKEQLACSLRRQGFILSEIAKQMGCSIAAVHNYIKQGIAKIPVEDAKALRKIMNDQCEYVINKAMLKLKSDPDPKMSEILMAGKAINGCQMRIAQLFGLDAPKVNRNINENETLSDAELAKKALDLLEKRNDPQTEEPPTEDKPI